MASTPVSAPRSFTIRVPSDLYLQICEVSAAEDVPINVKVNHLLRLGLDKHIDLNATLAKMLMRVMVEEVPA